MNRPLEDLGTYNVEEKVDLAKFQIFKEFLIYCEEFFPSVKFCNIGDKMY